MEKIFVEINKNKTIDISNIEKMEFIPAHVSYYGCYTHRIPDTYVISFDNGSIEEITNKKIFDKIKNILGATFEWHPIENDAQYFQLAPDDCKKKSGYRFIKDMKIGESGYVVRWACDEQTRTIRANYTVHKDAGGTVATQIRRVDRDNFEVLRWSDFA